MVLNGSFNTCRSADANGNTANGNDAAGESLVPRRVFVGGMPFSLEVTLSEALVLRTLECFDGLPPWMLPPWRGLHAQVARSTACCCW